MTPAEHSIQVARERATQDLANIAALRENEPFQNYFVRRLNERHAAAATAFKYDTLSHEDREVQRRLVLEYEDIAKMMAKDEVECHKLLEPPPPGRTPKMFGTSGNG